MKRAIPPRWVGAALVFVCLAGLLWFFSSLRDRPSDADRGNDTPRGAGTDSFHPDRKVPASGSKAAEPVFTHELRSAEAPTREQLMDELAAFLRDLKSGLSPSEVKKRRKMLQTRVHAAPPDVAAAAIVALLQAGNDAPTGLDFVVGPEGVMAETPTYRTELLNLLGQTDPAQSVEFSRTLMKSTSSQDEYSLALRNVAWADFEGSLRGELRDSFVDMLQRQEWRTNPTAGFLEAFDVAVFTGSTDVAAAAIEPAGTAQEESAVSRAGFVALDRIMLSDRPAVLDAFRQNPDFLSHAPFHRASIVSRLDPREPDEAQLLENYLLRSDHAAGELAYFAEVFPNGNNFSSHRLVTSWDSGGNIENVAALDQAALEKVRAWSQDPRFSTRREELAVIAKRLEDFLKPGASR